MLVQLFCECHVCSLVHQHGHPVFRQDEHLRHGLADVGARAVCARLHPQRRQHFLELSAQRHSVFVKEAQLEEGCICFEAICHVHWFLAAGNVVALERFPVHIMALDRADGARPSDIAGDAKLFPFRIAGLESALGHFLCLCVRHLVVGNENTPAMPAILRIQKVDGMKGCA